MTALTRQACLDLDSIDPLAGLRSLFALPDHFVYLDGNSLGALPVATAAELAAVIEDEWGRGLISSWENARWWESPIRLGDRLAPIIGANAGEVVVCDSTSINLFKVLAAALQLLPERKVIVADGEHFPSDGYVIEGLVRMLDGYQIRLTDGDRIEEALDRQVAAVIMDHVDYRSSKRKDLAGLTAMAHRHGALAIWDLSHSAGALPLSVTEAGVDFAVGCTYKFLNGGPGAPAFLFVAAHHQQSVTQPLSGWSSHAEPFRFSPVYQPSPGIGRFLCGTPAILSFAALEASLDIWQTVDLVALETKSAKLADLLIELVEARCRPDGLTLISPRAAAERGSHIAYRHPRAAELVKQLAERGVMGDFREPDILRLGIAPLYLRHVDIWDAVDQLVPALASLSTRERSDPSG